MNLSRAGTNLSRAGGGYRPHEEAHLYVVRAPHAEGILPGVPDSLAAIEREEQVLEWDCTLNTHSFA